ncbi:MAG: hypothetical protein CSA21_06670 [Deltaproteobacteria bacterium]|nr:MAG: hypothetical protein CSA21_06670 [Deltaproteobacteria bacterium]
MIEVDSYHSLGNEVAKNRVGREYQGELPLFSRLTTFFASIFLEKPVVGNHQNLSYKTGGTMSKY